MFHIKEEENIGISIGRDKDKNIVLRYGDVDVAYFEETTGELVLLPNVIDYGVDLDVVDLTTGYIKVSRG